MLRRILIKLTRPIELFLLHNPNLLLCILSLVVLILPLSNAQAVETHMVVELHKKIQENIAEIQNTNEIIIANNTDLKEEKKQIAREYAQARSRDEQRFLLRKDIAVRAKTLLSTTKGILNIQDTLEDAIVNLEQLDKTNAQSNANGVSTNSAEDKLTASNMMTGMRSLAKAVSIFDPTSDEMIGIREKLAYTDAGFRANFNSQHNIPSIKKQIEFLEEHHSTLAAVLQLIDREKFNLRNASNLVTHGVMEEAVIKLVNSVSPIYESILTGNNDLFDKINAVNSGSGAQRRESIVHSIDHIGVGY